MEREAKTLAELEAILLERLRGMPNGDLVEKVSIVLPSRKYADPSVTVRWTEAGADLMPLVSHAIFYANALCQQYEIRKN